MSATTADAVAAARRYRAEYGPAILDRFRRLLAIPNVTTNPDEVRVNASYLATAVARRGGQATVLMPPDTGAAVVGRIGTLGSGRRLGMYAHFDGQPVQEELWDSPPFEPTLCSAEGEVAWPQSGDPIDEEWRIYARAAADDKAPIFAMLTALDALAAAEIEPTIDLALLFDGEEEAGSPGLERTISAHRDLLDAEAWMICDGPVHPSRAPQLVFGVRGYLGIDLVVHGPVRELHSGHYGNWAPNPAQRLIRLLASMKDDAGTVTIAGFYDQTIPLEAAAIRSDDDDARRAELGLAVTEAGNAAYLDRISLPSLNVRGMRAAEVGDRARNVIPATAEASLDIRLAPGDEPDAMYRKLIDHVASQGYTVLDGPPSDEQRRTHGDLVEVRRREGYPGARHRHDSAFGAELATAIREASGTDPITYPMFGGSVPLYLFERQLGAPAVIVPIANHDNNQHAPNENLRIANLWFGIDLWAALLTLG